MAWLHLFKVYTSKCFLLFPFSIIVSWLLPSFCIFNYSSSSLPKICLYYPIVKEERRGRRRKEKKKERRKGKEEKEERNPLNTAKDIHAFSLSFFLQSTIDYSEANTTIPALEKVKTYKWPNEINI